jgi:hypothetical protein
MTHYLAQNAFNRNQVENPKSVNVLDVCDIKDASNHFKKSFPSGYSVIGIDLFFEGTPKVSDESVAEWVASATGLGLGEVISSSRTAWRDGKGFTLTIFTKPNTCFDLVAGLLKVSRRFSYLKAYEGQSSISPPNRRRDEPVCPRSIFSPTSAAGMYGTLTWLVKEMPWQCVVTFLTGFAHVTTPPRYGSHRSPS